MGKSVIIIGAGVAGLSTGCYLQMNGYKTRVLEMHDKPGGLITAWQRQGYTVDGCLHWLVGSSPGTAFHGHWLDLGMIQGKQVIDMADFSRYEAADGRVFTMYADADRLEKHMLELAPEDTAYIKEICRAIRKLADFDISSDKPPEITGFFEKMKLLLKVMPYMSAFRRWGKLTLGELADGFKNPLLREGWRLWGDKFAGMGVIMTLAWSHKKAAGYVIGGSMPLSRALEQRYTDLGGSVSYKSRVAKILVENDRAAGVRLDSGEEITADIVVSAADGHATIFDMLEGKYIDDTVRGYYDKLDIFEPLVFVALGVNRKFEDLPQIVSGVYIGQDKPVSIAGRERKFISAHVYNFDPTLAPEGKTVVAVMLESDYAYWKELRQDKARYKAEKDEIAAAVIAILDRRFPGLAQQVEMIDVATPATFERYTGNWQGSYEGWLVTPQTMKMTMKKTLPGLENFYMAGQWVIPGGGVPCGPIAGRAVTQLICHADKRPFVTSRP